ncbi:branched-chain amino acid transport system permease protein [Mesorhizobium soli]|uniref:branched-chain amino acid ABC transporter permease n=1 Tax=Pseudaminobacter soli (ex Li et al. 2025) TaxID=1295366 RepID=UPI0024754C22|nr:branched-chain amino acid ABC transporter permease [Mesorhizobium soli]MDH6235029.1 branched-chain amino acid transport system permease protein [Mesorhizobium soli]
MSDPVFRPLHTACILICILLAVVLVATQVPPAMQRIVVEALVKLTVVVGLFIFVGNSGVFSFGHVSFMAIGGYMSAILTLSAERKHTLLSLPGALEALQLPWPLAMLIVVAIVGLVALVVGWPLSRLRGIALPMATFGMLIITYVVASNWQQVTGGRQALVGLPRFTGLWVAFGGAAIAILIAAAYATTRQCLMLRCSRESEVAAAATGIDLERERLTAFVLSAMVVAMGGVLFSHFIGTITANSFYLDLTFVTLTMLVAGGMRSLTGACVGVALISIISELFRSLERGVSLGGEVISAPPGLQEIALAVILLAILILRPAGLLGDYEIGLPKRQVTGRLMAAEQEE